MSMLQSWKHSMLRKSKCQCLYQSHMVRGSADEASSTNILAISPAKARRSIVIARKAGCW